MRWVPGWTMVVVVMAGLATGGCVSRGRECPCRTCGAVSPATATELAEARATRAKYQELFRQAAAVGEAKAAEVEITRIDQRLQALELRAEVERRARHEPRTIIYGPLGFALNLTERVLQKLYILDVR